MNASILGLIPNPADRVSGSRRGTRGTLYVGSVAALTQRFIKNKDIKVVVSMTMVPPLKNVSHYRFVIPDRPSYNPQMQQMLPTIIALIDSHLNAGQNVLVHCHAGMQRAPTVVAHYLQKYEGHNVSSAMNLIRSVRPIAFINGQTFDLRLKK
jgi:protein tyrosine phosphatase